MATNQTLGSGLNRAPTGIGVPMLLSKMNHSNVKSVVNINKMNKNVSVLKRVD